jgi:hypothetical protein
MPIPSKREGPPKPLAQPGEHAVKIVNAWVMQGRVVFCGHCDGVTFQKKKLMMNTKGLTYFNLDWLNAEAAALICDHCGHIEWFTREPHQEPVPATSVIRASR